MTYLKRNGVLLALLVVIAACADKVKSDAAGSGGSSSTSVTGGGMGGMGGMMCTQPGSGPPQTSRPAAQTAQTCRTLVGQMPATTAT